LTFFAAQDFEQRINKCVWVSEKEGERDKEIMGQIEKEEEIMIRRKRE
jgi:hypothetical protein